MKRLAVIPSDTLDSYKAKGIDSWLRDYYNPCQFFDEVYCLSPLETIRREKYGLKIIPTKDVHLKRTIKDLNIDIVRAYGGFWPCDMACNHKVDKVPAVVSIHDTNPALLHNSVKKADIVFCVSETVKKYVLKKFNKEDFCWILPNRVDLGIMKPALDTEIEEFFLKYPFRHKILHVGRRTPQKNLDTLIIALKILGNDYCVISIGSGKNTIDRYDELAKAQGVSDRFFSIKSVPNNELNKYYSFADCMCTPSRYEGFGIVFIESMACGCVTITSDIGPMNEYIEHNYNGLLVKDFESPDVLARSIENACVNHDLRETIKQNSRASIEKFSKQRIDSVEKGFYEKILIMKEQNKFKRRLWDRLCLQ